MDKADNKWSRFDSADFEHVQKVEVRQIFRLNCPDLKTLLPYSNQNYTNRRFNFSTLPELECHEDDPGCGYSRVIEENELVLADIIRREGRETTSVAYTRAGPRKKLYFNPEKVRAGIVTCGGLCPGLNNVIKGVVRSLFDLYNVEKVYGFKGGFGGIYDTPPMELTRENVSGIHLKGGSILSCARGGFDEEKIINKLLELKINQLYVIGGDGTHRGALALHKASLKSAEATGHVISIVGIPKTIDNDVDLIDRSFGFHTTVSEACRAVQSAKTEAMCVPNGIGVVKLMGRYAGFIATHAAIASSSCDLCLIPEVPIETESLLKHVEHVLEKRGHAVIIVAEGAGETLLGKSEEVDAGGNRKLPPIGLYLKGMIKDYFHNLPDPVNVEVKYIDPSYMIRSVPANAADSLLCFLLAQNAVHGSMSGLTGFSVGLCNNRTVYLPISAIAKGSPRIVNPHGRMYERLLTVTGQPKTQLPELDRAKTSMTSRLVH